MIELRPRKPARLRCSLAALGVLLLGLLLAACGSDKKDKTTQLVDQTAQTHFAPGDPAPDFTLPTSNGSTVSLADYKGRQPVLLFFHMAVG